MMYLKPKCIKWIKNYIGKSVSVNDSYLHQHVKNLTRPRANQCPSILDLVLTNEENMISDLQFMAPLGKSDHAVLSFVLKCYTVLEEVTVYVDNITKVISRNYATNFPLTGTHY